MEKISDSTFQANMKEILDKVCDNHQPVIITRSEGSPLVIINLSDFKSYKEHSI